MREIDIDAVLHTNIIDTPVVVGETLYIRGLAYDAKASLLFLLSSAFGSQVALGDIIDKRAFLYPLRYRGISSDLFMNIERYDRQTVEALLDAAVEVETKRNHK